MAVDKDFIFHIIETLTKKKSTYTASSNCKKKFSDVAAYVRENKLLGKSLAGRVVADMDSGAMFQYKYSYGSRGDDGYYEVTIYHFGQAIQSMEVKLYESGAAYLVKKALATMDKELEDFAGKQENIEEAPKVDYSVNTMCELVDLLDKAISAFGSTPSVATFNDIATIKEALDKKISDIPLAERAPYSKPMSNISMFVDSIRTQLQIPGYDIKNSAATYVSQMQSALAEFAAVVK